MKKKLVTTKNIANDIKLAKLMLIDLNSFNNKLRWGIDHYNIFGDKLTDVHILPKKGILTFNPSLLKCTRNVQSILIELSTKRSRKKCHLYFVTFLVIMYFFDILFPSYMSDDSSSYTMAMLYSCLCSVSGLYDQLFEEASNKQDNVTLPLLFKQVLSQKDEKKVKEDLQSIFYTIIDCSDDLPIYKYHYLATTDNIKTN